MKVSLACFLVAITSFLFLPGLVLGQVDPSLNIYDVEGNLYTSTDNSTVFEATAGSLFTMEVTGAPMAPFGIFLSLYQSPFPVNLTPPPLFIMPPFLPIFAGPNMMLDAAGTFSFSGLVPTSLSGLGYGVSIYFQGFVQDPVNSFQLTNGIEMTVKPATYKADLALAQGAALDNITELGRLQDGSAGDNQTSGSNLINGAPVVEDPGMNTTRTYGFNNENLSVDSYYPPTSIFLTGMQSLVPGDAGIDDRLPNYPTMGSDPLVHTRTIICRNNENRNSQHIVVPIFGEAGEKVADYNVYHFWDQTQNEFGFMVVDVMNNDFWELTGTRKTNSFNEMSPWASYVAISPDGEYMAISRKIRDGEIQKVETMFIVRLGKDDLWESGDGKDLHARPVKINDLTVPGWRMTRVFAETMTFAGYPDPHALFFACNRCPTGADPSQQPPLDTAQVLYRLRADVPNGKGQFFDYTLSDFPTVGGNTPHDVRHYGYPAYYTDANDYGSNELVWLRSDDLKTIAMRVAGAENNTNVEWKDMDFAWDVLTLTNILYTDGGSIFYDINTVAGFNDVATDEGYYLFPFGQAYNGQARASISPNGELVAFVGTENDDLASLKYYLYLAPTSGADAGKLAPLLNSVDFTTWFALYPDCIDPYFLDDNNLLFFAGGISSLNSQTPWMDLFLYKVDSEEFRNLTRTSGQGANPPFSTFGDIITAGLFLSPDGRYILFLRGLFEDKLTDTLEKMNLVGLDRQEDYRIFDLTGDEFSGGFTPDTITDQDPVSKLIQGVETMNLFFTSADDKDLLYFTMKYALPAGNLAHNAYMVDLSFPFQAIPAAVFPDTEPGLIDNLVSDDTGNYLAFSRSNQVTLDGSDGAYEKVYVVDLASGAYRKTLNANFDMASIDGSLKFLSSPSVDVPKSLIYGLGLGGSPELADNPVQARLWLFPLPGLANPTVPAVSYPLTKEATFLLFNAMPYAGP